MHRYTLGIGAQKCASTWVHDVLAAHPQIAVPKVKELDFFSYHHDRGHSWYRAQFGPGDVRFENSPSYLHDPRSPSRVSRFNPDARIVLCVRDPVARAYSHHLHEIAKGHIPIRPFTAALADNPDYVEQGFYARHLGRWLDYFPSSAILCLLAEEIAIQPRQQIARLQDHLRLDPLPGGTIASDRRNVSDRPRSDLVRRTLRTGGRLARRLGREETLGRVKALPGVRHMLRWNSIDLRQEVPALTKTETAALGALFAEDTAELARLLGRASLPWQSWHEPAKAQGGDTLHPKASTNS